MNKFKVVLLLSVLVLLLGCGLPGISATETATSENNGENNIATSEHTLIPSNLPAERSSNAGDYDTSTTAKNKSTPSGDRFTYERFERPFNASTMDVYYPQLDIIDTFVFQDDTWIYGTMEVKNLSFSSDLISKYAFALDLNVDGNSDWLVMVTNLTANDWSVNGVQVFNDANQDIGGNSPMFSDKNTTSDGFESIVFDSGKGQDVDASWARISPNSPNTVEIAVKRALLGDSQRYLISMWAGTSLLDPSLFDLNDYFTHEQAGAADTGFEIFYPIKQVFELDNSCRMAVGFEPTGDEAGLCAELSPKPLPDVPGAPVCSNTCPGGPGSRKPYPDCGCIPQ